MVYLDMSVNDFLSKFPVLKNGAIENCEKHNLDLNKAKPFITQKKIGLLLNPDDPCPMTMNTFRSDKLNRELSSLIKDVLQ